MKTFIVRTSCNYSIQVSAENEADAKKKAEAIDMKDWDSGWEADEAEEVNAGEYNGR